MPSCIKCGIENDPGVKYCTSCGAMLPQMAPEGAPGGRSTLDLDEETEYLSPTVRYASEELSSLAWAAHDFLSEEGELDPFLDSYEIVKRHFESFKSDQMLVMEDLIANQKIERPEDPYPKQLTYLLRKGVSFYEEGLAAVDQYLAGLDSQDGSDDEQLKRGVNRILDGNDHFCLAVQLIYMRTEAVKEAWNKLGREGPEGEPVPAGGVEDDGEAAEDDDEADE